MKPDWREKRLKQLFYELGREDERKAPSFAGLLKSSLPPDRRTNRNLPMWGVGALAATLVLGVTTALIVFRSHSIEPAPPGDFTTLQTIPERSFGLDKAPYLESPDMTPQPIDEAPKPLRAAFSRTLPRHRRTASPRYNSTILISQWKSPTDVLLRTPGDELLKSLPRVPDSSPGLKRSLKENHN